MKSTDSNWDGADDYDYHEIVRNTRIIVDYHGIMEMMIMHHDEDVPLKHAGRILVGKFTIGN